MDALEKWMSGYRRAWESNDPDAIAALFAEDASYYPEPFTRPAVGREAIVASWLASADEPGETTFTWSPLSVTDVVAIIQGETTYPDVTYSNLWVIRLGVDGRATEFTEWWMDQSRPSGGA